MPQTVYNTYAAPGLPGQWADDGSHDSVSFPAAVAVPFGVLCELVVTGGVTYCQPVSDATTGGSFTPTVGGVSLYDAMREQNYVNLGAAAGNGGYKIGEMVPLARRGRVFVQWDGGGTWPSYGAVNVRHSSTGANPQGVFTKTAVSTTVGNEIDVAPAGITGIMPENSAQYASNLSGTIGVAIVSLNLG